MIAQQGRIIAVEGDEAVVQIGGSSGCPACDAGEGCGAGVFGRLLRRRPVSIQVRNGIGATVGQAVNVGISERRFLALVFRLYAVPVLGGLLGAAVGFAVASRLATGGLIADLWTLLFALAAAALALRWSGRRLGEFPLHGAVHLLHDATPPARSQCAAREETRSLKR